MASLRASSPIWASEASLARTRERGAARSPFLCPSRLRRSLARSRETRLTRPNRRACSQATSWPERLVLQASGFQWTIGKLSLDVFTVVKTR